MRMAGRESISAVLAFFAIAGAMLGQSRINVSPPIYSQPHADPAEGRKILEEFRQKGSLAPGLYLTFELEVRPKHGDGPTVPGRLWTGRFDQKSVTRIELQPGVAGAERRLLVQAGPESRAWNWPEPGGGVGVLPAAALFAPLAGTGLTAFDLQMPFLYWTDATYEGDKPAPGSGRPAHAFYLRPPAALAAAQPDLAGVRVYLDAEFIALVAAEEIAPGGAPSKSITVRDFKKVDQVYIMKTVDIRNAAGDTTRFAVTGAQPGLASLAAWFDPAKLGEAVRPPPNDGRLEKIAP